LRQNALGRLRTIRRDIQDIMEGGVVAFMRREQRFDNEIRSSAMEFDAGKIEGKFREHLQYVDDVMILILKGHLLIEESIDSILARFVFHADFLDAVSLRFPQKINLTRAFSLDEHANEMWELALAINTLRNELAHSLRTEKREKKTKTLREVYFRLVSDSPDQMRDPKLPDQMVIYWSIALLLGFLDGFQAEADRFREVVDDMDRLLNPHRHK